MSAQPDDPRAAWRSRTQEEGATGRVGLAVRDIRIHARGMVVAFDRYLAATAEAASEHGIAVEVRFDPVIAAALRAYREQQRTGEGPGRGRALELAEEVPALPLAPTE